ncbi:M28 family metallopeptidase [Natrialba sp. INN-245]|uniref:M28 family metallopeptidase n=1 Tax=Natrialba sp. INN-245 TaxID=2690967 RepID=UPI0013120AED|nr:M28 family metallopeptidase [Natrialba sp. INN-245]MWV39774.1 M28 family peptidase [Natrialba sp. INN-245]
MPGWIEQVYLERVGWDHLEQLCNIDNRLPGTDGEKSAAKATERTFDEFDAVETVVETFDILRWEREKCRLSGIIDYSGFEAVALPRSPSTMASGPVIDLGYGMPSDFEEEAIENAIVLVRSDNSPDSSRTIHRREKYCRAVSGGAAGFIFQHHKSGCLPVTGSIGTDSSPIGKIPAVGTSKELGERLRRTNGQELELSVSCHTSYETSRNVHAVMGPDTEKEVIVVAHMDAHDICSGAVDNASGVATLVEIAAALNRRINELETQVRLVAVGAEEVGYVGSDHLADRMTDIKTVVNIDSVAARPSLQFMTNGFEPFGPAVNNVLDRTGTSGVIIEKQQPYSDHWPFVKRGIPGLAVTNTPPAGGRSWGHTPADTLDKVDQRCFVDHAIALTELIVEIANDEFKIDSKTPSEIAQLLVQDGAAAGLRAVDEWDFE